MHLIETDAYDREARRLALTGTSWEALCEKGARVVPHFRELVEDLFAALFKLRVRMVAEALPSLALNRRLLAAVLGADATDQLRADCALESGRAAASAVAIGKAILAELKRGEALTGEELLDLAALDHTEKRIAELEKLDESLEGSEAGAEAMRERVRREIARAKAEAKELGARVDQALAELPRGLEARAAQAAANASVNLEEDEELARSFSDGVGAEGGGTPAERLELAERLRGNDKLRKLATLAGAFRRDALAARKKRVRRASSEVHRVGRGAEIARLLPSEFAGFVDPRRRLDFLRRLAERDLAEYELVGSDRGGRGPLVICVDGSGSMSGPRELWSKAVSLALLEVARRQNRAVEVIVFAGREAPLAHFPLVSGRARGGRRRADMPRLLDFAGCFPAGGTDFEKPLAAAMDRLEDAKLKGGDIVFVTDGEAPISEDFAEELKELQKKLDFTVYAVLIDDPSVAARRPAPGATRPEIERGARELRKITDRVTTVTRLTSGSVKGLFERL